MLELGFKLSAEEHPAPDLVRYARLGEEAGFAFAALSDHFHPWISKQGQSPFAWAVLGGVAEATERIRVGTAVTCPTIRTHPAIVAHAAATVATMLPGRFFLGLGTGENLNEHIHGDRWPTPGVRREMLEEAVEVIRGLWEGDHYEHHGRHYTVEGARLYSRPEEPPPILIAGSGQVAAELAGKIGDGFIGLSPDREILQAFDRGGGAGKPRYAEVHVCWAQDDGRARKIAHEWWPNTSIEGELTAELPLPRHFEQATEMVSENDVAEKVVCGPDPERHLEAIRTYAEAGYDHVWVHQVGPNQEGFLEFYAREILPKI
ncbi:MAG TPA: TIGR03557 family F420-dependent LLM class oxidoreductase [Actinomycetota bacterium]|nr:TIGR03557 family F420-dependent LLM class oxidoreductase [Actinomycetota bacterium]